MFSHFLSVQSHWPHWIWLFSHSYLAEDLKPKKSQKDGSHTKYSNNSWEKKNHLVKMAMSGSSLLVKIVSRLCATSLLQALSWIELHFGGESPKSILNKCIDGESRSNLSHQVIDSSLLFCIFFSFVNTRSCKWHRGLKRQHRTTYGRPDRYRWWV